MACAADEESTLRCALSCLRPFLALFGLVPSRVIPFFSQDGRQDPSEQLQQFPSVMVTGRQVTLNTIKHEQRDENGTELAVLYFLQQMLEDEAPQGTLLRFMQALYASNDVPQGPNVDAWRVHDIIQLACVYMPLQRALLDFVGDAQQVDVRGVVSHLSNERLLDPVDIAHTLDVLERDGTEAAMLLLLAFLYAARVDLLKERFTQRQSSGGDAVVEEEGDASPFWLQMLVQGIEEYSGQGFNHTVLQSVMTADTWTAAYEQLAYGGRGRSQHDTDDAESEAGESVASDAATIVQEDDDTEGPADTSGGARQPVRAAPETIPPPSANDRKYRQKRTAEYILGKKGEADIPLILKYVHHERERLSLFQQFQQRAAAAAAAEGSSLSDGDAEETSSLFTVATDSTSTENNSHVPEQVSVEMEELAKALRDMPVGSRADEGQITLRAYQEELLPWARQGMNVAIFLPTGTGKTFPVMKYIQELSGRPGLHRIAFLAPKVKLALFQYSRFLQYFPKDTYFRCGRIRSSNAPFSELLDTYKIFVMTPMCLVEAVQHKELRLTDFSMLVLDECHHAALGKHAYRCLMDLYMDVKLDPDAQKASQLPQVIGLTASPGVGQGKTLTAAVTHIEELCFVMDVEKICSVEENQEELRRYTNEPQHEMHTCLPREKDGLKKVLERIMKHIEDMMILTSQRERKSKREVLTKVLKAPDNHRGHIRYTQWVCNLENQLLEVVENDDVCKTLLTMAEVLTVYQRCLVLNEDCESQYALDYLQEQHRLMEKQIPANGRTERQLLRLFETQKPELAAASRDPEDYNPKLRMLETILLNILNKHQGNCACMVFVRTLELSKAIQYWIENHPHLKQLRPGRVTGTRRGLNDGGMTRNESSDVMDKFNTGEHKVVVCTSAAEEGLDFQACNIVIRYDYVTSLISMMQTRGRARRMDSHYCVLGNQNQGNIIKEKENMASERLMVQAVEKIKADMTANPNAFLGRMAHWQQKEWQVRRHAEKLQTIKRQSAGVSEERFQFQCRKCKTPACMSTDMRCLEGSPNAVVGSEFTGRWVRLELDEVVHYKRNLEKIASVICKNCSRPWGSLNRFIPTGREFPLLKLENFILVNQKTGHVTTKKMKWANAPFCVEDISEEELAGL